MTKRLFIPFILLFTQIPAFSQKLPDLIPYRKGDLWGYCDSTKKIIIEPKYIQVTFFRNGVACVLDQNYVGKMINEQEKILTEGVDFERIFLINGPFIFMQEDSVDGYCCQPSWGFISNRGERIGMPSAFFEEGSIISNFFSGKAFVTTDEGVFAVDTAGNFKMIRGRKNGVAIDDDWHYGSEYCFSSLGYAVEYKGKNRKDLIDQSGVARVKTRKAELFAFKDRIAIHDKNGEWKIIDKDLKFVKKLKRKYEYIIDYSDSVFIVGNIDSMYILDASERILFQFESIVVNDGQVRISDGKVNILKNGKWAFCDLKTGTIIGEYDNASALNDGIAWVEKNGYSALIDKNLHQITSFKYPVDIFKLTEDGFAELRTGWKTTIGYIDKYGTEYWED